MAANYSVEQLLKLAIKKDSVTGELALTTIAPTGALVTADLSNLTIEQIARGLLSDNGDGTFGVNILSSGSGGGTANLAYTAAVAQGTVTNDNGTSAIIPVATTVNAGLATPAMLAATRSPNGTTFTQMTNGQMSFVVDGVAVGNVTQTAGVPKWTLNGILDPTVYAGTPITTAARNALTAVNGYLIYNLTTSQYEYYNGSAWLAVNNSNDRLFLSNTVVAPVTVGAPTIAEITTAAALTSTKDTILYYTGTNLSTDTPTYVYHIDKSSAVTLLKAPSASGVLGYDVTLTYDIGDQRLYRGVLIQSNAAITANTAFNWGTTGATWKPIVPTGYTWQGVWLIGTTYSSNDVVTLSTTSNELYFAVVGNIGKDPASAGNAVWNDYRFIDFDTFSGATVNTGGRIGLVPQPFAGQTDGFLRSDGIFSAPALGTLLVANKATGGNLHTTSTTTPDYIDRYVVTQTTAGQTMTLGNAAATFNRGRLVYVQNSSSSTTSFTIYGKVLAAGAFVPLYWNDTTWIPISVDGSTTIQTLTDGASIAWDANSGNYAKVTINSVNPVLANITNPVDGQVYVLTVKYGGTARTLFFGSKYRSINGSSSSLLLGIPVTTGSTALVMTYDATNDTFVVSNALGTSNIVGYSVANAGTVNLDYGYIVSYATVSPAVGASTVTIGTPANTFFAGLDGRLKTVYLTLKGSTVATTYNFDPYWKDVDGTTAMSTVTVAAGARKTYLFSAFTSEATLIKAESTGGSSGIGTWTASTAYAANDVVEVTTGRFVKRTAAGTSGATFDNTEAALWTLVSSTTPLAWAASTYYYGGEILTSGNVTFRRTNSGISGVTLDAAEWFQYQYITQRDIPSWSANTAYIQGMRVYSPIPQQTLMVLAVSSHTTAASFTVSESSNWTFVSPALYYIPIPTGLYKVGDFALNPVSQTILMRNTADHTFSTWTAGEAANWTLISQGTINAWAASTIYLAGTKVSYKGGIIQRIATGTSGATFDATEGAAWISLVAGFDNWTASTYYYADTIISATFSDRLIKRVADGISAATFTLVESGAYELVKPVRRIPFVGATIYYASEQMTDVVNGTITYQAIAPHLSNATLDAAELTGWTLIGGNPYNSIANANYTVQETDDMIDLPAGATFTITIPAARINPIIKFSTASLSATPPTIATAGGETIIDPASYLSGTSFVMPGTTGLASSATFQKVGTNWRFIA